MGNKTRELLLIIRSKPTSINLFESYNESLIWWIIIEKMDIKAILGLRQYKSVLILLLAFKKKLIS